MVQEVQVGSVAVAAVDPCCPFALGPFAVAAHLAYIDPAAWLVVVASDGEAQTRVGAERACWGRAQGGRDIVRGFREC